MKSLIKFLAEALTEPKTIELDFSDLEGGKDARQSLVDLLVELGTQYTESGEKVTMTFNPENVDDAKTVYDQLMGFVNTIRTSQKRSSNEQYAQKTLSFANKVKEFNDMFDEVQDETPDDTASNDKEAPDELDAAKGSKEAEETLETPGVTKGINNKLGKKGNYNKGKKKEEE